MTQHYTQTEKLFAFLLKKKYELQPKILYKHGPKSRPNKT